MSHLPIPEFELATKRSDVIDESTGALLPKVTEELLRVAQADALPGTHHIGHHHGFAPSHELVAGDLLNDWLHDNFSRKAKQHERHAMLKERHARLIWTKIRRRYKDAATLEGLREHISIKYNLAIDVTKRSAVAFTTGMRRTITGISDEKQEVFQALLLESKIAVLARPWNQEAFMVGPVTVVPTLRGKTMRLEAHLPHNYDIVQDPEDPDGTPLAIAYPMRKASESGVAVRTVVLDGRSWRVFDSTTGEFLRETEHNLGFFPGETLRTEADLEGDWWGADRHRRVVEGTYDASIVDTRSAWTRKAQSKKLIATTGELSKVGQGQVMHPERAINIQTDDPNDVELEVFDFDISPENARMEINMTRSAVMAAYDIPFSEATEQDDAKTNEVQAASNEALTERRSDQVPPARVFDRSINRNMLQMALDSDSHPLREKLPSLEEFDEGYSADFGLVSRSFADPKQQIEWDDKQVARGHESNLSLLMQQNPGLSRKKAEERLFLNMEDQAKFNDLAARRDMALKQPQNVPTAEDNPEGEEEGSRAKPASATMTAQQLNGRQGPPARAQSQAQTVDA